MYIFSLVKYDGTKLGFNDRTADVNLEVFSLGSLLGSRYELKVGCTEGTELWISCGRVLDASLGSYDCTILGLAYYFSTLDWKFEQSVDGLELGTNEGTKLKLRDGIVLGTTFGVIYGLLLGTYDHSDLGSS